MYAAVWDRRVDRVNFEESHSEEMVLLFLPSLSLQLEGMS